MRLLPRWFGWLCVCGLALLGAGCAGLPPTIDPQLLLRDDLFTPPPVPVESTDVLQLSDGMRHYADGALLASKDQRGRLRWLVDALTRPDALRLSYDTERTRTAAEAYAERAGNCLSLTVMTAAFARHLGLPVRFQSLAVDEEYERSADLYIAAGHVNVVLGRDGQAVTVDFVPGVERAHWRTTPIGEATILAMFMNNRAAEALSDGRVNESYWWAREAVRQDPRFLAGANTLGVIYGRAGHLREAEQALRYVLEREPDHVNALFNLVRLLAGQGRDAEYAQLSERLAALQPHPPFWYFDRGREALDRHDFATARDLFLRELRRQPHQHEVHFKLAIAYAGLGQTDRAAQHLKLAIGYSPTRGAQARYAGKLDRLREATRP
jgi:tetratricopeptide (TPR) repeat protein